jgi:hypothetical protein
MTLEAKDEEIANLKLNSRVAKYHDLELKMKAIIDELITLKKDNKDLSGSFNK